MVRVWIADIAPLYEQARYRYYYERIPDFRREKADSLKSVQMKAQSVGVWSLWDKIRLGYGLPEQTAFNFSHSGSYVMCAAVLGEKRFRVGCDIEKIGGLKEKVAKRFFCPEEYENLMRSENETERAELFYRYWVLKESFMKATGKGMALPADSFCIRLGRQPELVRQPEEILEKYYYMEYRESEIPYRMAVCSTDREIDMRLNMEFTL